MIIVVVLLPPHQNLADPPHLCHCFLLLRTATSFGANFQIVLRSPDIFDKCRPAPPEGAPIAPLSPPPSGLRTDLRTPIQKQKFGNFGPCLWQHRLWFDVVSSRVSRTTSSIEIGVKYVAGAGSDPAAVIRNAPGRSGGTQLAPAGLKRRRDKVSSASSGRQSTRGASVGGRASTCYCENIPTEMPASTLDLIDNALRANIKSSSDTAHTDSTQLGATTKHLLDDINFEPGGIYLDDSTDKSKMLYFKGSETPQPSKPEAELNSDEALKPPKFELFPLESVQLGWRNKCDWEIGAGMFNMGNTCYLNSTLQALFHVPALANWLISEKEHTAECQDTANGLCIICAMRKTLQDSQLRSGNSIRPVLICNKLRFICRNIIPGRQEDAHEFLKCLLEAMEKSYLNRFKNHSEFDPRIKETTPLNQILGGYLRSAVKCLKCGHVSTTHQHFQDLLLDIRKAQTVDEAMEAYFSREKLDDDSYHCETCQKKVPATKQFALERAPMVLCIQLKRFSVSNNKITKHIHFRQRLDLTRYTRERPSVPLVYKLVALISHIGLSNSCGHYTAVAQVSSGTFYQFDDNYVKAIPHQNVFATNAYVMFYELESHPLPQRSTNSITPKPNNKVLVQQQSQAQQPETNSIKVLNGIGYTSDKVYGPELPPNRLASVEKKMNGSTVITNGNGKQQDSSSDTENASPIRKNQKEATTIINNGSNGSSNGPVEIRPLKPPPSIINNGSMKVVQSAGLKIQSRTISSVVPTANNVVSAKNGDSSCSEESNQSTTHDAIESGGRVVTKASMADWKVSSSTDPMATSETAAAMSQRTTTNNWHDPKKDSQTVNELYKMSHSGYGVPVQSWNGTRSQLEKEISNERREDRKRVLDQGAEQQAIKVKHQKLNHYKSNPGYNPVQEFHNAKNWNQNGNSGHYKQFYNAGNRHRRNNYHHKNFHKNYRFRQ